MHGEILINVTPRETRVALVENGVLQEVFLERAHCKGLVGNIYKGKVSRVLPGMQAAFIDIGLERAAFLHVSGLIPTSSDEDPDSELANQEPESITKLLHEGQDVLVQVTKDPLGSKGARLTTHLSIPSSYLVLMPYTQHIGVSQKIESPEERDRLKKAVEIGDPDREYGYIVRTAAEGVNEEALAADLQFLHRLWKNIRYKIDRTPRGQVVHEDHPLALKAMRDLITPYVTKVKVDSRENFEKGKAFLEEFLPEQAAKLEYYPGERPIFDLYSVEDEIQRALERKVPLKSGGYLIIDQTEAMTTVDVNTGAFVGHRNLEETIFKTNLEATQAIARQLRLRNLGGIIIIDYIDMEDNGHKRQVVRSFEKALERDHTKTSICDVSPLGLIEMTRKRTRESLEHFLCEPCPLCVGRGSIKSPETLCFEILREILRTARAYQADGYMVLASQSVIDRLLDEDSASLAELEDFIGSPIRLQVEPLFREDQYDIALG
ncbi:ribonuclease G [Pelagibaculum spongiae]|uniref:Ribonuclease G n=1 Tax=Pelagibaculum spongiae TaxID=2080658 RepID=A0A2V1GXP1_9GAMM|nr:ribonuclease G [Pelagibaculum spongiae]PVZ71931.1 ribonuclease G [Pelagibaculum spongiae]